MKAWQPVPTTDTTIGLFSALSFFFILFGIILLSYSNQVKEFSIEYGERCYKRNKEPTFETNKDPNNPNNDDYKFF